MNRKPKQSTYRKNSILVAEIAAAYFQVPSEEISERERRVWSFKEKLACCTKKQKTQVMSLIINIDYCLYDTQTCQFLTWLAEKGEIPGKLKHYLAINRKAHLEDCPL